MVTYSMTQPVNKIVKIIQSKDKAFLLENALKIQLIKNSDHDWTK